MSTTTDWLTRRVAELKGKKEPNSLPAQSSKPLDAIHIDVSTPHPSAGEKRSTRERLSAHTRQRQEGLSPRVLRRTLAELKAVVDPQVSEGGAPRALPAGMPRPRPSSVTTPGCS
jgi:malonyl-CoA decarboxylase